MSRRCVKIANTFGQTEKHNPLCRMSLNAVVVNNVAVWFIPRGSKRMQVRCVEDGPRRVCCSALDGGRCMRIREVAVAHVAVVGISEADRRCCTTAHATAGYGHG